MLGQLLFLGVKGTELSAEEASLFRKIQPGGYILFSRNIESATQVRKLTDDLRALTYDDPFIAIDNEGGRVWRTKEIGAQPPSAQELSEHANFIQIGRMADLHAQHLQLLGINMNFAPVLDIDHHRHSGVQNALRGRCWGTSANEVIDKAGLMNRRLRLNKLLTCGKHFPSCGHALSDPHHDLPRVKVPLTQLLAEDLIPYTSLLPEMNAIMTAHVVFPELDAEHPATLSKRVMTGLLRDQVGYEGVAITDDLDMGAIVNNYGRGNDVRLAIEAGNDMALICHQTDSYEVAYDALKELSSWVTDKAIERVQKQKKHLQKVPYGFSESRWNDNNKQIAELSTETMGDNYLTSNDTPTQSPVEDY